MKNTGLNNLFENIIDNESFALKYGLVDGGQNHHVCVVVLWLWLYCT